MSAAMAEAELEAADHKTTEKRLAALAKEFSDERSVLLALAGNPATSLRVLFAIAPAVPSAVAAHPAFVLLTMGRSDAFDKLPVESVIAMLAHGCAPLALSKWVRGMDPPWNSPAHHKKQAFSLALGIAANKPFKANWSAATLVARALSPAEPVAESLLDALGPPFQAHYRHSQAVLLDQVIAAVDSERDNALVLSMLGAIADHPNATASQLSGLIQRCLAARRTDGSRLFEDVESCATLVEAALTRPPARPEEIARLLRLADDAGDGRDGVVRGAARAASRLGLLDAAKRAALLDGELSLRLAMTAFSDLSAREAETLACDRDHRVRLAMAWRPSASPAELTSLAGDPVAVVAEAALRHPACPSAPRYAALRHPRRFLRRVAAEMAPGDGIAAHVATIASDCDGLTRLAAAVRRDAPAELLLRLAADRSPTIRRAIAKNPDTPQEALDRLASDPHPRVLDGLKKRPKSRSRT